MLQNIRDTNGESPQICLLKMCTRTILAKKLFTMYFFYWILGTFHIPPGAITQLFIVSTSVPYPVKQWLKTSHLSVKDPKQKSVMPHNPCLTTYLKENKRVLIYAHNPELITRMKHMRCFHNFEEPVKQMLRPAVPPFSCQLPIKDTFTRALFYRIHTYTMNKQG